MSDRVIQEAEDHIKDCYALINEQKAEIARLRADNTERLKANAVLYEHNCKLQAALEEIEANANDAELTPAFMVIVLGKIRATARKALEAGNEALILGTAV
jgi:hypothetical protein